jgi:hypothetical protein
VSGDNAPEFHDRFSIHPRSVESCRAILVKLAEGMDVDEDRARSEINGLSDWECVQHVERFRKGRVEEAEASQRIGRAAKSVAANLAALGEQLVHLAGHELAEETELFLAIDHPD